MVPTDAQADPFVGQLQAMTVAGTPSYNTKTMGVGDTMEVTWVDVNPATAAPDAAAANATIFDRGEGIWWGDGAVYFTATTDGQVFSFEPDAANEGGTLTLLANTLDKPDNITVAPFGTLFVAEDNGNVNHIRMVENDGSVSDFARNAIDRAGEFAGVCFSPDGKVLFVNIQTVGMTFAITGPFPEVVVDPVGQGGAPSGGAGAVGGSGGAPTGGTEAGTAGSPATVAGGMNSSGEAMAGGATAVGTVGGAGTGGAAAGFDPATNSEDPAGCGCSVPGAGRSNSGALLAVAACVAIAAKRATSRDD